MPIDQNPGPWRRKMGDPNGPPAATPIRRYLPDTWQHLRDIVREAEDWQDEAKPELRACGSHWAFSDAAVTDGIMVETNDPQGDRANTVRPRLVRPIYDVVPGALTAQAERFFIGQNVKPFDPTAFPDHSKFYLFHVQAGIKIAELYSLIDAGDEGESRSLAAKYDKYAGPWAMRTLGGAGGQTVAGAFSTGTHGGDVELQPIADAVLAVHLFGANGRQFWIEKKNEPCMPLAEESRLREIYGSIEVIRDEEMLNAVKVACGRFGIIYSVVLKVVRQYALTETRSKSDWSAVRPWVNDFTHPNFKRRFVQIVINPMGQVHDTREHDCYVTLRDLNSLDKAGTPPRGRAERTGANAANSWPYDPDASDGGGSFINRICLSNDPLRAALDELTAPLITALKVALATAAAATVALLLPIIPPPGQLFFEQVRQKALGAAAAALAAIGYLNLLRDLIPDGMPLSLALAGVANRLSADDRIEYMRHIAGLLIGMDQTPRTMTAISYAAMDIHNYRDANCIRNGDSIEIFFNATSPELPAFIDRVFERVRELENGWMTGDQRVFPGYIALRYMKYTDALIGMQKWLNTCSIEIAGLNDITGTQPLLAALEQDAIDMGATLHWGQRNNTIMKMVERCYDEKPGGRLFRWRARLAQLTRNGRDPRFSTPFSRRAGLEVVQPRVYAFTIEPTTACAGELVTVTWEASDNPPGTQAFIEVRPHASTAAAVAAIPLPSLGGTTQIAVPAGRNDFRLVAAYELNGRTLSEGRMIETWGVQDGETMRFELPATCLSIDGAWRWGVPISFWNTVSPHLEVAELACRFAGGWTWYARKQGTPDVEFSWLMMTPWRSLAPRPKLQGEWSFFFGDPGCINPQPNFWAEFKLACGQ